MKQNPDSAKIIVGLDKYYLKETNKIEGEKNMSDRFEFDKNKITIIIRDQTLFNNLAKGY